MAAKNGQRVRFHQTHTMLVYRVRVVWFSAAILNQLHDVDVYQAEYWLTTSINTKKGKIACHLFFTWREAGFGSIVVSCLSFFSVFFCGGFIHPRTRDLRVGAPNFLHLCSAIAILICSVLVLPGPAEQQLPLNIRDKHAREAWFGFSEGQKSLSAYFCGVGRQLLFCRSCHLMQKISVYETKSV